MAEACAHALKARCSIASRQAGYHAWCRFLDSWNRVVWATTARRVPMQFGFMWIYNKRLSLGKRRNNLHVAMPGQLPTLPGGRPVPSRCAIHRQPWGQQQSRRLAAGIADVFGLPWRQFGQAFSSTEILQLITTGK